MSCVPCGITSGAAARLPPGLEDEGGIDLTSRPVPLQLISLSSRPMRSKVRPYGGRSSAVPDNLDWWNTGFSLLKVRKPYAPW